MAAVWRLVVLLLMSLVVTSGNFPQGERHGHHGGLPTVTALVFAGRRQTLRLLNCYLERDLLLNGGRLAEVIFVVHTENKEDLAYIDWLVSLHPGVYRKRTPRRKQNATDYDGLWEGLQPDRFYVKIDDDIVFIQEGAIQALLNEKLTNDRFLFTSANVINHPILSSVHAHLGALTNFEPHSLSNNNWRRMPGAFNLDRGPCEKKENASHWWSTWECAALAHFSFFRNFQAGRMQDFTFGVWDFHADSYVRWSINFFLFRSSEMPPITMTDDEHEIAVVVPQKRRQHCGALGAAVVSHFSYLLRTCSGKPAFFHLPADPQRQGLLDNTNILEQYEELARLHLPECSSL